jgi:uncharacterized protein (DUF58 family)
MAPIIAPWPTPPQLLLILLKAWKSPFNCHSSNLTGPGDLKKKLDYKPIFTLSYFNRTLQVTREGGGFIFLLFAVGIGAINTGNNLLYLILAMCCSFIAVSGVLSEQTLKGISIHAHLPKTVYPGDSYPLYLKITNSKKTIPSYSLYVDFPLDLRGRYRIDQVVYTYKIRPQTTLEKNLIFVGLKRGPVQLKTVKLKTSFPFGFFVKTKSIPIDAETLIFPTIKNVALPSPTEYSEEGEGTIGPAGDDLYSIREYQPGDPMATVHWKSSAKTGTLRVKEFSKGGMHNYTLILNIIDPQTNIQVEPESLENRVTETASLAYHLIRRGDEVNLKTPEIKTPSGNTETHLENILKILARIGY